MRAERTIEARPPDDELSALLGDVAREFDLRPKEKGRLAGGTLFTADPNDTFFTLTVLPREDGLRLIAHAYAFPGSGAKVRRLTEARLGAVADFMRARLRGVEPKPRALFRPADADLPGAAIAAGWIGAATAAAMLAAFVTTTAMACVITADTLAGLHARSPFIAYLGKDPLPTVARLQTDGPLTVLAAAALFALPCAFLVGALTSAALAWTELGGGLSARAMGFVRDAIGAVLIGWGVRVYFGDAAWTTAAIAGLGIVAVLSLLHVARGLKVLPLLKAARWVAAGALVGWILLGVGRGLVHDYAILTAAALLATGARRDAGLFAFVLLALLIVWSLFLMTGPLVAAAFAMAIPLSSFGAYLWVWGRRREKRDDRTAAGRDRDERRAAATTAALLLLGAVVAAAVMPGPRSDEDVILGMARFRDRMMMTNPIGRVGATLYYRYTLYAAEPLKAPYEYAGDHPYRRLQPAMLLAYPKAESLPTLHAEGFYVTPAWEAAMDPRDVARRFDHPYDLFVLHARDDPADPAAPLTIAFLEEVESRGLWDRTVVLATSRTYERSPEGVRDRLDKIVPLIPAHHTAIHDRYRELQAAQGEEAIRRIAELRDLIDRTPWDLPAGVPPDRVLRVPYGGDEELFRFLGARAQSSFEGRFMRDWVGWGWQSLYYLGGPLVACAALLPPALLFAWLFRRMSRRRATRITGAVFVLSVIGLIGWASANAETAGALAELRRTDDPARPAAAMAHADADVRYEAVFVAHERLKGTRRKLNDAGAAYRALELKPPGKDDMPELERLQRAWWDAWAVHERLGDALAPALLERLTDPDVRVRVWASGALGQRGAVDGPDEIDALLARLRDPEFFVVYRAAGALGDIGAFEGNAPGAPFRPLTHEEGAAIYRAQLEDGNVEEIFIEGPYATARLREPLDMSGLKHKHVRLERWPEAELTGGRPIKVRRSVRDKIRAEVIPELQRLMREEDWYVGDYALNALRQIDPGANF